MTQAKKIVTIFSVLFGIVFFAMLLSFIPGDRIEFTNLPTDEDSELTIDDRDPIYGSNNPDVLIYHFGDFSNSSSAEVAESLKNIADSTDNVTIVWKDFPNTSLDPESWNASIAARCAQKQDAFWEFHDYLFVYPNQLSNELYGDIATELGLWQWSFNRCLSGEKTTDWVEDSYNQGMDLSLTAAPTLFINSQPYAGYMSQSDIESIIDSILLGL